MEFQAAINHPDIKYDGSKAVYVDPSFRLHYKLRPEIRVPEMPPVDSPKFGEYLDLRRQRFEQIAEETDAIKLANEEAREPESAAFKGRPYATGEAVAEILEQFEADAEIRHYMLAPVGEELEAEDDGMDEEELETPQLKRAKTYNPHRTPFSGDTLEH